MRIAYIVDGRSDHVRRWLRHFIDRRDEILLLSTYPTSLGIEGIEIQTLPGLFQPGNVFVNTSERPKSGKSSWIAKFIAQRGLDSVLRTLWHQINILDVFSKAIVARQALNRFRPDIVHAQRIQNEGYITALAGYHPWVLSVWGNEFTYFCERYRIHNYLTKRVLRYPDGLTADCNRDIRLALEKGLSPGLPTDVFLVNGGINTRIYRPGLAASERERLIVYPRGKAPYLCLDTLVKALQVLANREVLDGMQIVLLMPPALVDRIRKNLASHHLSASRVKVQAYMTEAELADIFQRAAIMASPSFSDGVPNSMVEAMACGAFPVMGDIDSLREWITPGVNGLLCDPHDPVDLADALIRALDDVELREKAQKINYRLVQERAVYTDVMPRVVAFYEEVIERSR